MPPRALSRSYTARAGAPVLTHVHDDIFTLRYFTRCMACGFCKDACCTYGVDVDEPTVLRILGHASSLERRIGVPRTEWFEPEMHEDAEHPGGRYTRTRVRSGMCVFHSDAPRGCALHAHALAEGLDYHAIKPMVSALFPLTFDGGLLHASSEASEGSLVCGGEGPSLYRGARSELEHYFGAALVEELDVLAARVSQ